MHFVLWLRGFREAVWRQPTHTRSQHIANVGIMRKMEKESILIAIEGIVQMWRFELHFIMIEKIIFPSLSIDDFSCVKHHRQSHENFFHRREKSIFAFHDDKFSPVAHTYRLETVVECQRRINQITFPSRTSSSNFRLGSGVKNKKSDNRFFLPLAVTPVLAASHPTVIYRRETEGICRCRARERGCVRESSLRAASPVAARRPRIAFDWHSSCYAKHFNKSDFNLRNINFHFLPRMIFTRKTVGNDALARWRNLHIWSAHLHLNCPLITQFMIFHRWPNLISHEKLKLFFFFFASAILSTLLRSAAAHSDRLGTVFSLLG